MKKLLLLIIGSAILSAGLLNSAVAGDDDSDSDSDKLILSVDVDEGSFDGPLPGESGAFNVVGDTGS